MKPKVLLTTVVFGAAGFFPPGLAAQPLTDLSPSLRERVVCSIAAAVKYEIPANILLAVAEKEGGRPGQWVRNVDGSHDIGTMQFNTNYLRDLARYGITANDVAASGCYPYELAAWRLRGHITKDAGDIWTRAANYHSREPRHNATYRADLIVKATKWADWLAARFRTMEVTQILPRENSRHVGRELIHKTHGIDR